MTRLVRGLADLASGYNVVLSDVWGVVHNGLIAFERAAEALGRFRAGGGKVVLMTNSPNPSRFVEAQLARLGVTRKAYDAIVSSGDVTVPLLVARAGAGMFHIGPPDEIALFQEVLALCGERPPAVPLKQAEFVLCTGLADPWHETPTDYDAILAAMRARNLELICANPDGDDRGDQLLRYGRSQEYVGAFGRFRPPQRRYDALQRRRRQRKDR